MYNDGELNIIASGSATINDSKYSVSKNPLTRMYYRLHILNVEVSDVKKYRCGKLQYFYLQLILIGRCNTMVIYNVVNQRFYCCW